MRQNPSFTLADVDEIRRIVDANPWATIVSNGPDGLVSSHYVVLLDEDRDDLTIVGHVGRPDDLIHGMGERELLVVFQGPHGYITPEYLSDKDWAPTWNFAVVVIEAEVAIDATLTDEALRRLVAHMERDSPEPWSVEAMGARYATLRDRVIGFRATITSCRPRFKLGQDESDKAFAEIVAGLGDRPLARWMRAARQAMAKRNRE